MENKHHINSENEQKTLIVIILTIITMAAEVTYGYMTNSMALLADGYHMGTHALALSLTYIAYVLTRKFSDSELFQHGTDKIGILAAYTSSIFLGLTGVWIIFEAIKRFINPVGIQFNDAIIVAIIGFCINTICIMIMEYKHCHDNGHEHHHCQGCEHEKDNTCKDYNFKSAYYHILADALTSLLAIAALFAGKYLNFIFLDPLIGILGGILILRWAVGLLKSTIKILIDMKIK